MGLSAKEKRLRSMRRGQIVTVIGYLPVASDDGTAIPVEGDLGRVVTADRMGSVDITIPGKPSNRDGDVWRFFECYRMDDLRLATKDERLAWELSHE